MVTHRKRALMIILLLLSIGISFGYFSRYPDLNRKAMVAESASVADTIAMWPILKVKAYDPLWKKIVYTTVNWANDNKKGMTFGIIIASLLASLMGYVHFRPSNSRFRNTFYGFLLGTPLGICVNCAAPVFKGMLQSRRIEMALALMFSSPTLNVVVVTMAFTLLPLYMAVTKLLFNLLVIFGLVPLMARYLHHWPVQDIRKLEELTEKPVLSWDDPVVEPWGAALKGFAKDFWKHLAQLFTKTVPLMLVAGFMGSLVSHLVPLDLLRGAGGPMALLVAAATGIFLPVPMAFDVVLTHALYTAGVPASTAMILLLSLGVFSFYSFIIVAQSASRRWAFAVTGALVLAIIPLGFMAPSFHDRFYLQPNIDAYQALRMENPDLNGGPTPHLAAKVPPTQPSAWTAGAPVQTAEATITPYPFLPKASGADRFVYHEGPVLGLDRGFFYTIRDYPDPFWIGRGTASGDYDQDGWPDIVFGSDHGVYLYHNVGGRFEYVAGVAESLENERVFAVALVDMNNDGWLDLFVTSFQHGNFLFINQKGSFSKEAIQVPNGDGVLTVAPSFADLKGTGYLDVFNGNMVLGIATGFREYGLGRGNSITWNEGLRFRNEALKSRNGETMASLFSDINNDGHLDLYENNDFTVPDQISFGQSKGTFEPLRGPGVQQFQTPYFSMSVDTGDVNNDLKLDLLVTGTISGRQDLGEQTIDGAKPEEYKKAKDSITYCEKIKDPFYKANCIRNRKNDEIVSFTRLKNLHVKDCQRIPDSGQRDTCLLSMMWMIVTNNDEEVDCRDRYSFDPKLLEVCELMRKAGPIYARDAFPDDPPQIDKPVLYLATPDGGIQKAPQGSFEHPGGWTWSSKLADFDNDGWLDMFNAEGAVRKGEWGFNVLMHNKGSGQFEQKQFSWGLVNDFNLFSFTLVDFDRDGDLDIIGNGADGPPQIYENQLNPQRKSFGLRLHVPQGNQLGLGAKVFIRDSSGRQQLRELKAGGGYQSFDAPEVYFGLDTAEAVEEVRIVSLSGKSWTIHETLKADQFYDIKLK